MTNEYFFIEYSTGRKYIRTNQHCCAVLMVSNFDITEMKIFDKPYLIEDEDTKAIITASEFKAAILRHLA